MKFAGFCFIMIGILLVVIWYNYPETNSTNPLNIDDIKKALGIVKICAGAIIFLIFLAGISLLSEETSSSVIKAELAKTILTNDSILEITNNSIKIGNIEVTRNDLPGKYNWEDAKKTSASLGDGWRLPTKLELAEIFSNRYMIGNFTSSYYWSSSIGEYSNIVWTKYFFNGSEVREHMIDKCNARAVRSI